MQIILYNEGIYANRPFPSDASTRIGLQKRLSEKEPKHTGIKKGNLPRFPIFINLKSNTMKNTVQR